LCNIDGTFQGSPKACQPLHLRWKSFSHGQVSLLAKFFSKTLSSWSQMLKSHQVKSSIFKHTKVFLIKVYF